MSGCLEQVSEKSAVTRSERRQDFRPCPLVSAAETQHEFRYFIS